MHIEWNITKKRGNLRPILHYAISLSEYETALAMPAVRIESTIPRPPDASWQHCWPGRNERGPWEPSEHYLLMTPPHREPRITEALKLPWRADNVYPEVEASFRALREAFERVLTESSASEPLELSGRLETSAAVKRDIAPAFAAERLLRAVGTRRKAS